MRSLPNGTEHWLSEARNATKAAERLTDPDAKAVMLCFAELYLHLAHADTARARAGEASVLGPATLTH